MQKKENKKVCEKCGTKNSGKYCTKCGYNMNSNNNDGNHLLKIALILIILVPIILSFLLGIFSKIIWFEKFILILAILSILSGFVTIIAGIILYPNNKFFKIFLGVIIISIIIVILQFLIINSCINYLSNMSCEGCY